MKHIILLQENGNTKSCLGPFKKRKRGDELESTNI